MFNEVVIKKTENFVRDNLKSDTTGHDWWHVDRVRNLALYIAKQEEETPDLFIIELAALLHDIADWKFHDGNEDAGSQAAGIWLNSLGEISKSTTNAICAIVEDISFKGSNVEIPILTLEGKIVQDADRLDAMGAIGIARTFAFGGARKREIYNPHMKPSIHTSFKEYKNNQSTTINHFYEKLLLLKDNMHTTTGKLLAEERHQFMKIFIEKFLEEWQFSI